MKADPRTPLPAPAASEAGLGVHLALVVVQLSFSGLHVFGKVVLESVDPLALAALRVLFATPALLLLAWHRDRLLPRLADMPRLALLGLLGVCLNQVLFITGLAYTTATNAAILMASIPVFAVGLGALLRVEPIGPRRLAGVALTVAGALVVLDPRRFTTSWEGAFGDLLVLLNCLSYAAFLVLQRPVLQRLPWRTVLAWCFVFGGAGVLAVGGGELAALEPRSVPAVAWGGIAYILLFPTLLAYSLATWAVRRSSPLVVAAYVTVQPLVTALVAVPVLGDALGWRQTAGFVLIAAGLWRVGRRSSAVGG